MTKSGILANHRAKEDKFITLVFEYTLLRNHRLLY